MLQRKDSEKMKKVSLLLLSLSLSFVVGATIGNAAEEEVSVVPFGELKTNDALQAEDSEIVEPFAQNERAAGAPTVTYRTHVQNIGWQGWKNNGQVAGTSGQAKRLEAIELKVKNSPYSGEIQYSTHIQNIGWQGWKKNGQVSGTSGQAKRLEAIRIKLTGELGKRYDVFYRVHAQNFGWMGWEKGGIPSGTSRYAYRLEAIEVKLVPKKNYFTIDFSAKTSYRDNTKVAGELDSKKLGIPNKYLDNGLKLFKDSNSVVKFADKELYDANRKTIAYQTYELRKNLKKVGYTVEFYYPY